MKTLKLAGAATKNPHMVMNNTMSNTYISLEKWPPKSFSYQTHAHGLIDNGKYSNQASKHKWTESDYHVQDSKDLQHK